MYREITKMGFVININGAKALPSIDVLKKGWSLCVSLYISLRQKARQGKELEITWFCHNASPALNYT